MSGQEDNLLIKREAVKSEQDFNSMFENLPVPLYIRKLDGAIIEANEALRNLSGYCINELRARRITDLVPPRMRAEAECYIRSNSTEDKGSCQLLLLNKKGHEIPVEISIAKTEDGILAVLNDITERRNSENEFRKILEEMAYNRDLVEESAAQVARSNQQLEQSENELREINASKDKFFSIIAHDLKSPFTALLGFSEFIAEQSDDLSPEEIKEFGKQIYVSAKSLFNLLENLLNWSRIQTGRMEFQPSDFTFNSVLNEIKNLYGMNLSRKSIKLIDKISEPFEIYADKNMINTVIRNLVSNAVKFTPQGGTIEIDSRVRDDGFLVVSVLDSGIGIEEKDLGKLFRIDVHHTTEGTDHEKGTGLGLILCKELIEKNGGKIWVASNPGKGTSFSFSIPLAAK